MRYRLKPRRHSCKKRTIWLVGVLCLICSLLLTFYLVDLFAAKRVAERDGPALTEGVTYRTVDGASLAYRRFGSTGTPILMIHGFLGSSHDFSLLWPDLSSDHQVIAVDLIGFGLSDKSTELLFSKQNMARLCAALMAQLGFDRYIVLGHSMGGEVSLHLALTYPDRVEKLILLNSAGWQDLQQGRRMAVPGWFIEYVFQNYLAQRLFFPLTVYNRQIANTENFNRFFFFNDQIPAETLIKLTQDNDSGQLAGRLGEIRQPALLIWGAEDRTIPLAQGEALDEHLPDSQLVVIDQCGHLTFLEKPQQTLEAILAFLAED
ncbi:MAG: alpha/beta hydrolase [Bacillota bacterium]|nr:alpha/beta hydrolase [Bacillota bacterium]